MKILVADDDLELRGLISFSLRQAGYMVIEAADGAAALAAFGREAPDLVILDVNMPRMTGFEVLRQIRGGGSATPVMMLTVRSSEEDQVQGLDSGGDDYLTKPFSPRALTARVRALMRRAGVERPAPLAAGDLVLDSEAQTVSVRGGAPVRLTSLEFRLLQFLAGHAGRVLPGERLSGHIWGNRGAGDKQLLKQLVHRLRRKLERDPAVPDYLLTEPGLGYRLQTVAADPRPGRERDAQDDPGSKTSLE